MRVSEVKGRHKVKDRSNKKSTDQIGGQRAILACA